MTEGGEDSEGKFHHVASFQDSLLAEFFSREVFALLLHLELISEALVEKISGCRHSGFSVHSKVRAQTRKEAERVGKYMIRPLLSLERLSFSEKEDQVTVRYLGLYANAHRGKMRKAQMDKHPFVYALSQFWPRCSRRQRRIRGQNPAPGLKNTQCNGTTPPASFPSARRTALLSTT